MKQYKDETELAAAFLRIMQKLYILRNLDDVPAELTLKQIFRHILTNQALSIVDPQEQALIVGISRHLELFDRVLFSGIPYVMHEALSQMNSYDRVFVKVMHLINENRGTHREGGFRLLDDDLRIYRKDRARRVLAWTLRSLNLASHPVFTPMPLDPSEIERLIFTYKRSLIAKRPEYRDVFEHWTNEIDSVKYILNRRLNQLGVPHQIISNLSPESEDLCEFFFVLILRQQNRLADSYLSQYQAPRLEIARQNFIWILNQKNILDDINNPPYGVSAMQIIKQLYSADGRGLDQNAVDFLNERRENFAVYNEILELPSFDDFLEAFSQLPPEDQAFISVLQRLDKFYRDHGRFNAHDDSWYSSDFYGQLSFDDIQEDHHLPRFYSNQALEQDLDDEEHYYSFDDYSSQDKDDENLFEKTPQGQIEADRTSYDPSSYDINLQNNNDKDVNLDLGDDNLENSENNKYDLKVDASEGDEKSDESKDEICDVKEDKDTLAYRENENQQLDEALFVRTDDEQYNAAYNRTIEILLKTGFIGDIKQPNLYDPHELFTSLIDTEKLHLVDGEDVKFLIDRSLNTAVYLAIFRLDSISRERLIDSLQSEDKGFVNALLSLEKTNLTTDDNVNDNDLNSLDSTEGEDIALDKKSDKTNSENKDQELSLTSNDIYKKTISILLNLKLIEDLGDLQYGTVAVDVCDLFAKIYTLDNFIMLEKDEQLFLYERRHFEDLLNKSLNDKALFKEEFAKLNADDQAFIKALKDLVYNL